MRYGCQEHLMTSDDYNTVPLIQERKPHTLIELLEHYNDLHSRIVLNEGEVTPDIESEFDRLSLDSAQKVDTYAYVLEKFKHDAEFWKKKIENIEKIKKGLESAEARLKQRIKSIMVERGLKTLEGFDSSFHLSKAKDRILVEDEKLPPEFWQERIERFYDKELIREELKDGPIPGVHLEQSFALRQKPSRKELNEK